MCTAYLFDIFIGDIAYTATFQKNKSSMYYIVRASHETPNTHTIELTPMLSLYFYSIFVEYPIYCNFNAILAEPSISPLTFHLLNQRASSD